MKKLLLILLALCSLNAKAAGGISDFFGDTRADEVFKSLTSVARLDMLDYYKSGMTNPTNTEFGSFARITALEDSVLVLDCGMGVSCELVLLPSKKPVLMLIETLPLPEKDSRIRFFDSKWNEIANPPLAEITLDDWLTDEGRSLRGNVEDVIPFMLSTAKYEPKSQKLVITSNIASYFAGEKPSQLSLLKPELTFVWNGKAFKPVREK